MSVGEHAVIAWRNAAPAGHTISNLRELAQRLQRSDQRSTALEQQPRVSLPANPTGSAHLRPGGDPARWSYSFSDGAFVRRVLIIIALGALAALVWRLAHVLLLGNELLLALANGAWVNLRVPYPLGFYAKWMDGRASTIPVPAGRAGLYGPPPAHEHRFHMEGGKGTRPKVVKYQLPGLTPWHIERRRRRSPRPARSARPGMNDDREETRDAHARRRGLERNPRPHPPLRPGKPPVATSATGYPFRLKETPLGGRTARGVEIRELAQGFLTPCGPAPQ